MSCVPKIFEQQPRPVRYVLEQLVQKIRRRVDHLRVRMPRAARKGLLDRSVAHVKDRILGSVAPRTFEVLPVMRKQRIRRIPAEDRTHGLRVVELA